MATKTNPTPTDERAQTVFWSAMPSLGKWRYAVAGLLAIVLVLVIVVGWMVASSTDEVLGNTFVGPIDAGGLTDEQLRDALAELEIELEDRERVFSVAGTSFGVFGDQVGLAIDADKTTAVAMDVGRSSFWETISASIWRPTERVDLDLSVDELALASAVETWNQDLVQPFEGEIIYTDGSVQLVPPRSGTAIDATGLGAKVLAAFAGPPEDLLVLETREVAPEVSPSGISEAMATAEALVADSVTLRSVDPVVSISFSSEEIGSALTSRVEGGGFEIGLDPDVIATYLEPLLKELEAPAVDAEILITEFDTVRIAPSQPGGVIDANLVVNSIIAAADRTHRTARLVYVDGAEAAFSTADAEALGIKEMVSDFTTFHACCQPRVQNIQQIADIIDGAILMPGEELDVNAFVGPRTVEKGFVAAPMILAGRFVDSVGGGISQFATTLYNAVFFGGYTDVTHRPHSYYFSRYPEGREATVSFPQPDLIFRNDTDAALLIKTEYTDTSITVKFFGDNGGIDVAADLSERSRFRSPVTEYQPDASLVPGDERLISSGTSGWDVTVTRTITYPDGTVTTETWDERYRPQPRIVRRHPCSIPGAVAACPTTTTTTTTTSVTPTTSPN